jgi:hypothetical protein
MDNYKSQLEITLENLKNARKNDNDYLIENAEIEELLNYLEVIQRTMSTLLVQEDKHLHKLNDIQDICDDALRSEEAENDVINITIIEEIEEVLNRDE